MNETKKIIPLDDLEMFELLQAAYPEKFADESNETWEAAQQFADDISGFDAIADLLGRVATLTMPMKSGITDKYCHCLGRIEIVTGKACMTAVVMRPLIVETEKELER